MRHFWSDASKWVMAPAPLLEARIFAQVVSTSPPSGVTSPSPVTTTRRIAYSIHSNANGLPQYGKPFVPPWLASCKAANRLRSALVLVDKVDRILDGRDLLSCVVRDFDTEFLFKRHDQFDDDLLHAIGGLAHVDFPSCCSLKIALAMADAARKRVKAATMKQSRSL